MGRARAGFLRGAGRQKFFTFLGGVVVGVVTLANCNTYDTSLLEASNGGRPPSEDGVGWWSEKDSRGCFSAGMPTSADRPKATSDKDVGPIVLAVSSMRLGSRNDQAALDPNAWQDIGFDLDGVCTASETCTSEDPPPSCKAAASQLPRDGKYCRDNTFGKLEYTAALVPSLANKYGLSDDAFNCALCVGHYNFLIRVTGYNGESNDDRVRVDMYPSPGLEQPFPWDCTNPNWVTQPCFTADMPWTVQEDVLVEKHGGPDLPSSKVFDDNAYVRDGYLVISLPEDTLFWFPGYKGVVVAYPLRVQRGLVVGKIAKGADNIWTVTDGVIAGRIKKADVVDGFRLIGFCETNDAQNYGLMNTFVNDNLDVLADGRSDPNASCDAMSMGLLFSARQARAGKTETVPPLRECVIPRTGPDAGDPFAPDASSDDAGVTDGGVDQ